MKLFTVYDGTTGQIFRTGYCLDGDLASQAQAGESVIEGGSDPATQYVDVSGDPDVITNKSAMGTSIDVTEIDADGTTEATISSIPSGTYVYVNGAENGPVTDGSFILTSDVAKSFSIVLKNDFSYLEQSYTVTAVAVTA